MQNPRLILVAVLTCVLGVAAQAAEQRQKPARFDSQIRVTLDYLLYLPSDYDKQSSWPLVLFLHGAGERGSDLELLKKHGPPKLIEAGKEFPFIVVSPQCPKDRFWTSQMLELTAIVDEIAAKHKVDQDRIYVTGISMGGFGTWTLAAYTPDRFAAVVPICGGGEPIAAMRLANLPVWAFHGGKDPVVPLKRSEDMVEAVKRSGGDAKLTVYPEAGHDSWTETYDNPDVYSWLLLHTRKSPDDGKR